MIKNVIFDFVGTIADTLPIVIEILNNHRKDYGIGEIEHFEIEKFRSMDLKFLLEEFNIHILQIPFLIKLVQTELSKRMSDVKVFTGISDVFKGLSKRGINLGVVTTNYEKNVTDLLTDVQEKEFLFIRSENALFGKHKMLKKVMKEYRLNPLETIYVGDGTRDIEAARKSNIKIISVSWGFNSRELLLQKSPDFLVDSPSAILQIVDTLNK